jgi:hypothetical protein
MPHAAIGVRANRKAILFKDSISHAVFFVYENPIKKAMRINCGFFEWVLVILFWLLYLAASFIL